MAEILHVHSKKKSESQHIIKTGPSTPPARVLPSLLTILLTAGLLEVLYLLLVALSPLPGLHLSKTPLIQAWPWTLLPSQLLFPGTGTGTTMAQQAGLLVLLSLTLAALMGAYALLVWRTSRVTAAISSRWLILLMAGALLFGLTLLFQPALFSDDVFTYIFSGRILSIYHADPLNTAPIQFPADPYLQWMTSGRQDANIYGPLWLLIASLLSSISNSPVITLLLYKGLALLSHLVNCVLIWAILTKIAPQRRLLGTLLYAWNPLALIELAGSGHSEGLLSAILLLATLVYVEGYRSKGRWHEITAMLLFGLAMSINLVALLIAPLFIWFLLRHKTNVPRVLWGFCWRALVSLCLVIPIYMPFWRGASTFFAIISVIDMQHFVHSPIGLLTGPVRWTFGLVDQWLSFPPVMQPTVAADMVLRFSAIFIFALIYIQLFGNVRRAPTTVPDIHQPPSSDQEMRLPGFDVLTDCWASAIFWYLVLIMGWFWPWYVLWALWIVGLRRPNGHTMTVLLLSGTALLIYPLLTFAGSPFAAYQSILIFGVPLVYLFMSRKKLEMQ
jgi:hypothetical protein